MLVFFALIVLLLTHISLASYFWDIGKQYRPRWDAAERGVSSESTLFAYRYFYKKWKNTPDSPKIESGLVQMIMLKKVHSANVG